MAGNVSVKTAGGPLRWLGRMLGLIAFLAVLALAIYVNRPHAANLKLARCDGERGWSVGRTTYSFCRSRNPSVFTTYGSASTLGNILKLHLVCGTQKLDAQFVVGKHFEKSASPVSLTQKQRDMYQLMRAHDLCSLTVSLKVPAGIKTYSNKIHIKWVQQVRLTI